MNKLNKINRVLSYIIEHNYTNYRMISNDTGIDKKSVQRYVKILSDRGLVYTKSGTGGGVFLNGNYITINTVISYNEYNSLISVLNKVMQYDLPDDEKSAVSTILNSIIKEDL